MSFKLEIKGLTALNNNFKRIGKSLDNLRKPLKESDSMMLRTIDLNIENQGTTLGKRWKKRTKNYPWRILQKKRIMRGAFKDKVGAMQSEIFNNTPYFKFHQLGVPKKKLPQRIMMQFNKKREDQIINIFNNYVKKIIG